jgi:hypothetical protein
VNKPNGPSTVGTKPKLSTDDSLVVAVPAITAAGAGVGLGVAAGAAGAAAAAGAGVGAAAGALLSALSGAAAGEGAALAFALALVLPAAVAGFPLSLEFGSFAALAGANEANITIAPSANKLAARPSTINNRIVASARCTQKNDRDRFGEDTSEECVRRNIATRAHRVTLSIRPQAHCVRLPQKHPKKIEPRNARTL